MTITQALGQFLAFGKTAIFLQPPGVGFVPLLLTQLSIPTPTRAVLDLSETEAFERRWTIARNPIERFTAQSRITEPETLTIVGALSATPLLSPLQSAGLLRLDKAELAKLGTILAAGPSFVVTPERPYANMGCTLMRAEYNEEYANGVKLTLQFQEIRIASPLSVVPTLDLEALSVGASSTANAGAQTPAVVPDPGGLG